MTTSPAAHPPWYRQFWPWFLILIPSLAVIGGFVTLWLALSHPETLVVDEREYEKIRGELRAQQAENAGNPEADEQH
jgi:hypothetical protein